MKSLLLLLTGHALLAKDGGISPGPDLPVKNVPPRAAKTRTGEMGVSGILHFNQLP